MHTARSLAGDEPSIKGTRIPASLILGYFAAGNTIEEIIAEFPDPDKIHKT